MTILNTLCTNALISSEKQQPLKEILKFITINPDQRKNIWKFKGIQVLIIQEIIGSYEYLQNEEIQLTVNELDDQFCDLNPSPHSGCTFGTDRPTSVNNTSNSLTAPSFIENNTFGSGPKPQPENSKSLINSGNTFRSKNELNPAVITVLKILENLTADKDIRSEFIANYWHFFVFPFLNNSTRFQKNEQLTISALKIISNLIDCKESSAGAKNNFRESFRDSQYTYNSIFGDSTGKSRQKDFKNIRQTTFPQAAINFLKNSEVIPLLLKIIDSGNKKSLLLAIKIFYDIISNKESREYSCQTFERFVAINIVLSSAIVRCCKCEENYYLNLNLKKSAKPVSRSINNEHRDVKEKCVPVSKDDIHLLKTLINCYITLCQFENVRASFKSKMPRAFNVEKVLNVIDKDSECRELFKKFKNLLKE